MADQLRMYTIKPGEMASWLEEWGRLVAPLRRRSGFEILGAWTTASDQFVWILRYEGPKTWEEADAAYYASPVDLAPGGRRMRSSSKIPIASRSKSSPRW